MYCPRPKKPNNLKNTNCFCSVVGFRVKNNCKKLPGHLLLHLALKALMNVMTCTCGSIPFSLLICYLHDACFRVFMSSENRTDPVRTRLTREMHDTRNVSVCRVLVTQNVPRRPYHAQRSSSHEAPANLYVTARLIINENIKIRTSQPSKPLAAC